MTTEDASAEGSRAHSPGTGHAPPVVVLDGRVVPTGLRYGELLQAAYSRGWTDGSFAAPLEPTDRTDAAGPVSQGLGPADFALLLWGREAGEPPAGLDLNAPLWYARGFAEGIAAARR